MAAVKNENTNGITLAEFICVLLKMSYPSYKYTCRLKDVENKDYRVFYDELLKLLYNDDTIYKFNILMYS